jgi:hypothetical protein
MSDRAEDAYTSPAGRALLRRYRERAGPFVESVLDWQIGLECLGAQAAAWRAEHPGRAAFGRLRADGGELVELPRALPEVSLLPVPAWGRALTADTAGAHAFLQGWNGELYLRLQGCPPPDRLALVAALDDGRGDRAVALEPVAGTRRFALPYLNGGPGAGALWYAPGLDAREVLRGHALSLSLRVGGPGGIRALERVALWPVAEGPVRTTPLLDGDRLHHLQAKLLAAIAAFTRRQPAAFAEALGRLGGGEEGFTPLRRPQALWLSAMVAEIARCGAAAFRDYGCAALAGHPQLLVDVGRTARSLGVETS